MSAALSQIKHHGGKVVRYPGGRWIAGNKIFGSSTINALVIRKLLEYTVWKEGRRGTFPVEAALLQPPTNNCCNTGPAMQAAEGELTLLSPTAYGGNPY
jgi:hypothetical protein